MLVNGICADLTGRGNGGEIELKSDWSQSTQTAAVRYRSGKETLAGAIRGQFEECGFDACAEVKAQKLI